MQAQHNIIWVLPAATACTGWLTVQVLTCILLRKVLPRSRPQIAAGIGKAAKEFIDIQALAAQLNDPVELRKLNPTIEAHLDSFLQVKLKEKLPVISAFVGPSTLGKLKDGMMEEIEVLLPELITQYTAGLGQKIDVQQLITGKLMAIPQAQVDTYLRSALKNGLGKASWIGALTGLIVGLVFAVLIYLL